MDRRKNFFKLGFIECKRNSFATLFRRSKREIDPRRYPQTSAEISCTNLTICQIVHFSELESSPNFVLTSIHINVTLIQVSFKEIL
jgi:hypothetical protein